MIKFHVNDKEHYAEIEAHGNITTLATDTTFAIMQIYRVIIERGGERRCISL